MAQTSAQDRYVEMMERLSRHNVTCALAIWILSIAAAWGEWSVMGLGVGLCLAVVPFNVFINKVVLQRHGAFVAETARAAANVGVIALYAVAADWPLPVWMWLPFMALVTDPVDRRLVLTVVVFFAASMSALALLSGVSILYPVMFTTMALHGVYLSRARFAVVHDMLEIGEEQRRELERALVTRKAAEERAAAMRAELVEVSRKAGMAEVASNVLHSVGNVLNSVNVTANLVCETIRSSKVGTLARLVELLRGEAHALPRFFAEDPRARHVPDFLAEVHRALDSERHQIAADAAALQKHIDHIQTIVSHQQSHATAAGVLEDLQLADLVEDALSLNQAALASSGVTIVREYDQLPPLSLDRHKILQILINLIGNARDAVRETAGEKSIRVRLRRAADSAALVEVSDTGTGISAENLGRIFNHGFTTKKDRHGFGLHASSCAAIALGGTLTAQSDGVGRGATFTLRLPPERVRVTA